jgi:hypothetical protein
MKPIIAVPSTAYAPLMTTSLTDRPSKPADVIIFVTVNASASKLQTRMALPRGEPVLVTRGNSQAITYANATSHKKEAIIGGSIGICFICAGFFPMAAIHAFPNSAGLYHTAPSTQ